jgi:hypothetical protein
MHQPYPVAVGSNLHGFGRGRVTLRRNRGLPRGCVAVTRKVRKGRKDPQRSEIKKNEIQKSETKKADVPKEGIEKDIDGKVWHALMDGFSSQEQAELAQTVEGARRREIAAKRIDPKP